MERVSKIMLKIGMILSIVMAAIFIFMTPFFITFGVSATIRDMIIDGVNNGDISSNLAAEDAATVFQVTFLTCGIMFAIFGIISMVAAIIDSKTLREPTHSRYIACIIFGFLSTEFAAAGGILGLIHESRSNRQKVVEEQPTIEEE